MALQDIINTIIEEAKIESEKIKKEGFEQIKEIEEKESKKVQAKKVDINSEVEREGQKVLERAKLESNIEERNQIVSMKQKLVNEVFSKAIEKVKHLDEGQYTQILLALINQLPDVEKGIILPAEEKLNATRNALEQSGKNYELSGEEYKCSGGFIFKSDEIEVDNSFEELFKGLREELEIEISNKLFS